MELTELPPEVLHVILFHAALGRGVKRTVRLRLVCKVFARLVYPALFETHLMDHFRGAQLGSMRWLASYKADADKLWHRYVVYRVMGERDATVGRLVEIREVALAVCREAALDMRSVVDALCWLALDHDTKSDDAKWQEWGFLTSKDRRVEANPSLNMLTAAVHLNLPSLVEVLLGRGQDPTKHNFLFAPPALVAAQAGNVPIMQLFRERTSWPRLFPLFLIGAVEHGDMDILKISLQQNPANTGDHDEFDGQSWGSIHDGSKAGKIILKAKRCAPNPIIYEYLNSALLPWHSAEYNAYEDLIRYSELGNMTMVRHLLDHGVPIQRKGPLETPLAMACRRRHNDLVDLLLDRGADPNFVPEKHFPIYPLHESATAGNFSVARKLLDRGAIPDRPAGGPGRYPLLWWAFAREEAGMVRLLLDCGASFDGVTLEAGGKDWAWSGRGKGWLGKDCAKMAYHLGHDSMTELLKAHGFEVTIPLPWPTRATGQSWYRWEEAMDLVQKRSV